MRDYVDRFEKLVALFNRQRKLKSGWKSIDNEVLKDTFIGGIKPVSMKMLVKQHLPATLSEAQTIAITESDEVEESSDVGPSDLDSESDGEQVILSRRKTKFETSVAKPKIKQKVKREKLTPKSEVEKKMDDLTESLQKLTLLVESKNGASQSPRKVIS
ncbi:hypothetical protein RO3G_02143 [Rhizopus delemar RA 99-880]|uniref:Uncharacterized protein n=1 Tax=Rhizopus delemar (strain RA 99-880 / ATCC MYA-4621 / FGSC 9543 / NRRL 43880) TaxID=246409 RepID=I1BMK9_RHIO9|nr:hypothetical protein RO3G_02143 [Rhizopus delemar RA 99-880]|eukprot:EIE77439.1 hypothetical protein RO3G_02143 [Rhizopus delemar RA 99-880]